MFRTDVLVIGAGPSGTVAAAIVKKAGLSVRIVEKESFPRFVIGESLIPRVMDHFEEAGFLPALHRCNWQKKFGARFKKGDVWCEFDFSEQFTKGWTWTWQVPRAEFDMVLAEEVQKQGVPIDFRAEVVGITLGKPYSVTAVRHSSGREERIQARFIIDASGYGRVIPRLFGMERPTPLPPRKAIFVHCYDHLRPRGREGWMISFVVHRTDVWIWVIPFNNGITSLGVVGDPTYINRFGHDPEMALRTIVDHDPNYCDRFRNVEYLWKPRVLEAYSATTSDMWGPGFAIVGNSVEFLDPVFSSGVMFATETASLAAKMAIRQLQGENVDWKNDYAAYIRRGVDVFRTYVCSWYDGALQDVFFAPEQNPEIKRQLTSILAGYVWDENNPFVKKHETLVYILSRYLRSRYTLPVATVP
ncbi:MAG: tryptophan 7-halogenase [Flavobacteriales bacterium]|nr:tryptophan 7-halogenase [Flavobacteriales bacterium]MCX7768677.1 tryptophan 7-halogenase [Flavobacteriales bacterium]MDW8410693.1 NAD(P)/FAD-dependent oxidoreductase [Flavobacteriales bacterium]